MKDEGIMRHDPNSVDYAGNKILTIKSTDDLLDAVFQAANVGICVTNDRGEFVLINDAYCRIYGYAREELIGRKFTMVVQDELKEYAERKHEEFLKGAPEFSREWNVKRKDGKILEVLVTAGLLQDEDGRRYKVTTVEDITEQNENKKQLEYLSTHSSVTNLPNRYKFEEKLKKEIENSSSLTASVAMLYININRFRRINDSYGFQFGDKLLKFFASRLKTIFGKDALIGYLGVDNFGVVLRNINSEEYAGATADLLIKRMTHPFVIESNKVTVDCSVGISIFPQESKTAEDLVKNSEEAMRQVKKSGHRHSQFYTQEMNNKLKRRRKIEADLKTSLNPGEMFLVYQPQVDIITGKIMAVEALIRWKHPDFGMVSPAEFIPLAEEIGEINKIGEWTIREACRQSKIWAGKGINLIISVNISSLQLNQDNIVERIIGIVTEEGIDPSFLELEITEGSIIEDINKSIEKILRLKQYGIRVDIDDFGTGYSSLNYLRKLPLYKLKIDKSFIVDFSKDFDSMVVTKTIIDMAHNLRFKVIAEGVETAEQLRFLKENRCDEIQGYYYSKPLPPKDFEEFWSSKPRLTIEGIY